MKTLTKTESIRQRILAGGERFWSHQDLADYSSATIAKTFTQLVKEGILQRISKGHYYHPRPTRFGYSQPVRSELPYQLTQTRVYPAGVNAANLLGFTTQNAIDGTFATTASSLPTAWLGQRAKLYTRRPSTWENLSATEAALLDFLRSRGEWSDLSPAETNLQLLNHFRVPGRFERLVAIVHAEPPRVRAMLGAIGQELKYSKDLLQQLGMGLNPYSRFEFGKLSSLWYAQEWQAK
jgi:DNA-binding transcriptional regulator YhcF (GntR family)